jgi:hypothetical protein
MATVLAAKAVKKQAVLFKAFNENGIEHLLQIGKGAKKCINNNTSKKLADTSSADLLRTK